MDDGFPPSWTYTFPSTNCMNRYKKRNPRHTQTDIGRVSQHSPSNGYGFPPSWTYTFLLGIACKNASSRNLGMPKPPNLGTVSITLPQGVIDFHLLGCIHFLLGIACKNALNATLGMPKPPKIGKLPMTPMD
jgi:hypothetical protein